MWSLFGREGCAFAQAATPEKLTRLSMNTREVVRHRRSPVSDRVLPGPLSWAEEPLFEEGPESRPRPVADSNLGHDFSRISVSPIQPKLIVSRRVDPYEQEAHCGAVDASDPISSASYQPDTRVEMPQAGH